MLAVVPTVSLKVVLMGAQMAASMDDQRGSRKVGRSELSLVDLMEH